MGGIFHNRIPDIQTAVKLSTTRILSQNRLTHLGTADYILFELNRQRIFNYVEALNLDQPEDDIEQVLKHIAQQNSLSQRISVMTGVGRRVVVNLDFNAAARMFVRAYEVGLF